MDDPTTSMREMVYRFCLGCIAGCIGAAAVYPLDLAKTRLQNQRTAAHTEEVIYKNIGDCIRKVIHFEGYAGLYKGIFPQLLGVAPEKAIKLTTNDLVRNQFIDAYGNAPVAAEILAGACAGISQVVVTNPLEIAKIRWQTRGEIYWCHKVSLMDIFHDMKRNGFYLGASACYIRDALFTAIYFPSYYYVKKQLADIDGSNNPFSLFIAGSVAAIPAAFLATPMDVIKTRLQVEPRSSQTTYTGFVDAAKKIYREEGLLAFCKGGQARITRFAPQFGITLVAYEMLQQFFHVHISDKDKDVNDVVAPVSYTNENGLNCVTVTTLGGVHNHLGLSLPKFTSSLKYGSTR